MLVLTDCGIEKLTCLVLRCVALGIAIANLPGCPAHGLQNFFNKAEDGL